MKKLELKILKNKKSIGQIFNAGSGKKRQVKKIIHKDPKIYESDIKLLIIIILVIITLIFYIIASIITKAFKISDIKLKY